MRTAPWPATLMVGSLFVGGLLGGAWTGARAADRARDPYAALDILARALTVIEQNYIEEMSTEVLVEAAVRGMTEPLDDHSQWMSPEEYRSFREENNGAYEGIGIEVRAVSEGVLVVRVLPGGPAARDGLLEGDVIVAADGNNLVGLPLSEVNVQLKGSRGSALRLTVARSGWEVPREIHTVRDRVYTPAIEATRLPGALAYVRILQFQEDLATELQRAIHELDQNAPLTGLVLDLRDNPGGLLDQAVSVVDLFQDDGVIVSTRSRAEGEVVHRATAGGLRPGLRVAVLVNGLSASAAEIVAAALQDTGRARLFGARTYGKGSVQTVFTNRDQSAIKLTIGRYYTPSGKPIEHGVGVAPDVAIAGTGAPTAHDQLRARLESAALPEAERDELLTLLALLPPGKAASADVPWSTPPADRGATDPPLAAAQAWLLATP